MNEKMITTYKSNKDFETGRFIKTLRVQIRFFTSATKNVLSKGLRLTILFPIPLNVQELFVENYIITFTI